MILATLRTIAFLTLLGSVTALADDGEAVYKDLPAEARSKFVAAWKAEIILADDRVGKKRDEVRRSKVAKDKKKLLAELATLEAAASATRKNVPPVLAGLYPLKVGAIGIAGNGGRVIQVIDKETVLIDFQNDEGVHVLKGFDTSRMIAGESAGLKSLGLMQVPSMTTYKNAAGVAKTAYLVQPFIPPWEKKASSP